jgi:hypothetical protein
MERKSDALREHWSALDEEVLRIMRDLPPSKVDATGALIRETRDAYPRYIEAVRRETGAGRPAPPRGGRAARAGSLPPRTRGIPAVGEPPQVCARFRWPSWNERMGLELTMAITPISEQRRGQARRPREASPPLGGQRAKWTGGRRARHRSGLNRPSPNCGRAAVCASGHPYTDVATDAGGVQPSCRRSAGQPGAGSRRGAPGRNRWSGYLVRVRRAAAIPAFAGPGRERRCTVLAG